MLQDEEASSYISSNYISNNEEFFMIWLYKWENRFPKDDDWP